MCARKSESVIVTGEEEVRMCVCVCVCVCVGVAGGGCVQACNVCVWGGLDRAQSHEYNRMNIQYSH